MFVDFFLHLRNRGVPVSTSEFFDLLKALSLGLAQTNLDTFYSLSRCILVKDIKNYDKFDVAFSEFYNKLDINFNALEDIEDKFREWLQNPIHHRQLSEDEKILLDLLNLDELREEFLKRLKEQKERHDGGSHWIGTGGTSPFGHGGYNPAGIRVGGPGRNRSAVQIAEERRFRNLRSDLTLNIRQFQTALRQLRVLSRDSGPPELDLDQTIEQTANNAGDIEIVFRKKRRNRVKLLLLMDVGGSMDPHTKLCSMLFSAAHQSTHFKAFQPYYFHNCPYESLYTNILRGESIPTNDVLRNLDETWRIIFVGDAAMATSELLEIGGSVDYFHFNERTGIDWLNDFKAKVSRIVWLNPEPERYWNSSMSCQLLRRLFPMFPLTVEGLHDAIDELRSFQTT